MEKLNLIKDPIHGVIPYTTLEKIILSSVTFNRLHNIHQNSLTYLVYPGARTSRFTHSIGVMHIASNIFRFSFINARNDDLNSFLEQAKKEIDMVIEELPNEAKNSKFSYYGITGEEIDRFSRWIEKYEYKNFLLKDKVLKLFSISNFHDEFYTTYLTLLQAVRISGLLHDVGHLPLSHLSEDILSKLLDTMKEELDNEQKQEIEKIKNSEAYLILDRFHNVKNKIHEILRYDVLDFMLSEDVFRNKNNEQTLFAFIFLKKIVNEILRLDENTEMPAIFSLRQIISGDLDADRLDFVCRDLTTSGFLEAVGDVNRIVENFVLVKHENEFYFKPSIRVLNSVEEIIEKRFTLYRYLVFHHRVCLYRRLVEKVSLMLMDKKKHEKIENGIICNNDIMQLVRICNKKEDNLRRSLVFAQIDDNWFLNLLRQKYFKLRISESLTEEDELLKFFLGELLRQSRELEPLLKIDFEFKKFVIDEIIGDNTFISKLKEKVNKISDDTIKNRFEQFFRAKNETDAYLFFMESIMFLMGKRKSQKHFIEHVEKEVQRELNDYRIVCSPVLIKEGLSEDPKFKFDRLKFYDDKNECLRDLDEVSNLPDYLYKRKINTTAFYVFYPKTLKDVIKSKLSEAFKNCILDWLEVSE